MIPRQYSEDSLMKYTIKEPNLKVFNGKEILMHLDSFCLGDTICFSSLIYKFMEIHNPSKLIVSTFLPHLFEFQDERVTIVKASDPTLLTSADQLINVGYDKNNLEHTKYGMFYATKDTMMIPLDSKPGKVPVKRLKRVKNDKKIVIAPESLKKIAKWDYFGGKGWQIVIDYLTSNGYEVYNISYENTLNLKNVHQYNGFNDINIALGHILSSRLFIGLSSGLSWLAWAYDVPVVMISNFTKSWNEFDCYRVDNPVGCNGCFNIFQNIKSHCPIFEGTLRENECHKKITPDMVIKKLDLALSEN
jgi:autotransporter strand-loop-strand O-heptosyltransferase